MNNTVPESLIVARSLRSMSGVRCPPAGGDEHLEKPGQPRLDNKNQETPNVTGCHVRRTP
jgi:hypothetical protein